MAKPRTAVITGSSRGIGLAVAQAFLKCGDNVVFHGRDADKLKRVAKELGSADRIETVAGGLEDVGTGQALVTAAMNRFGSLDVLVNNAGMFKPAPFFDVTPEELDRFLIGNLRGTYLITQAVAKKMSQIGGGSIVNIGTVLVNHGITGLPCSAPIVSKGGIHALTTSLAAELAPMGIRVNLVSPGIIRTPLHGGADVDSLSSLALLNRVGEPEEIAQAVLHLADAAFATGVILPVDGGHVAGHALGAA